MALLLSGFSQQRFFHGIFSLNKTDMGQWTYVTISEAKKSSFFVTALYTQYKLPFQRLERNCNSHNFLQFATYYTTAYYISQ
jgi:hypothetical protein